MFMKLDTIGVGNVVIFQLSTRIVKVLMFLLVGDREVSRLLKCYDLLTCFEIVQAH